MSAADFVCGLDLGRAVDYTAAAVLRRRWAKVGSRLLPHFDVVHLERWPLGTAYSAIVAGVKALMGRPPLRRPPLAVDETGAGAVVVDELILPAGVPARVVPVLITGGNNATREGGRWHVPKKLLASTLSMLMQSGRLQIAPGLALAPALASELQTFSAKISVHTGNESFEAWRSSDKDDLVLATVLAAWVGSIPPPRPAVALAAPARPTSPPGERPPPGAGNGILPSGLLEGYNPFGRT